MNLAGCIFSQRSFLRTHTPAHRPSRSLRSSAASAAQCVRASVPQSQFVAVAVQRAGLDADYEFDQPLVDRDRRTGEPATSPDDDAVLVALVAEQERAVTWSGRPECSGYRHRRLRRNETAQR
jgi:hypothetical protein